MILNRIEIGTSCTIRKSGETGKVNKIFFYPTKFEIEFPDGHVEHHSSKDIDFEGIEQAKVTLRLPEVPKNGIGDSWSDWSPFKSESFMEHHFSTSKEIMWEMLTSLEMYNVWFHGIQRALPVLDTDRYVHKYSFTKLDLEPGAYFKIRPMTIAPWFTCRVMTMEKEKEFGFTFKTTPLSTEYVQFSIRETDFGVWVKCRRTSEGLFSILDQFNWQEKSKSLQRLDQIVPKTNLQTSGDQESTGDSADLQFGGFASKQDHIDYAINMGMQGNMDYVNAIPEKPIRGMAKAGIVKAKRTGELPPCPEKVEGGTPIAESSGGGVDSLSKDDLIAYLVNKGLDGDMDTVNAHSDKIIRGKTKAMIVKIERGSIERPTMPDISTGAKSTDEDSDQVETDEQKMERLIAKGIEGDMDEINALDNKILRGKIKSAIVKAKRASK
jgi:hypothetical protein|tara:strand:- start:2442 stop:3755 length:1314 start_codon:yes stop_codon:yes gene_type:complete